MLMFYYRIIKHFNNRYHNRYHHLLGGTKLVVVLLLILLLKMKKFKNLFKFKKLKVLFNKTYRLLLELLFLDFALQCAFATNLPASYCILLREK